MDSLVNIDYIAQLLFNAYNIPIIYMDEEKNIIVNKHLDSTNPVYHTNADFISSFINDKDPFNRPLFKTTYLFEDMIVIRINFNNTYKGTLFIGPTLMREVTEEMVSGFIQDYSIPSYYKQNLLNYYEQIKLVNQSDINHTAKLAYYLIFGKKLDEDSIITGSTHVLNKEVYIEKEVQDRRLEASFHMDHRQEQYIWQCIKDGNKEKLIKHLDQFKAEGIGLLSKKSHIRHIKNLSIISIALATRAAIDGGLYPEIAFTMSDVYIQHIEDSKNTNQINLYVNEYLFQLIDRVHATKANNQSKHVSICKNYIFNHIFEKITLEELAELVHLNPTYLSQVFKKETGVSLGKYISNEKLNEAKRMLIQSEVSISEISMLLQFSDQSYFTSIFKKYTGSTPRQYRNNPDSDV